MTITSLKGVGEKTAQLFEKLDITTTDDLLVYYPRDYEYFSAPVTLEQAATDEVTAVSGRIRGNIATRHVRGLSITAFEMECAGGGILQMTYFNMPYLKNSLKRDTQYVARGYLLKKGGRFVMEQAKLYKPEEYGKMAGRMMPCYGTTKGLTNNAITKAVRQALAVSSLPQDHLPDIIRESEHLDPLEDAIRQMHFPDSKELLVQARERLVFDEFLLFILMLRRMREDNQVVQNQYPMIDVAQTGRLLEALPYRLTAAQQKVWTEIRSDLTSEHVMNRLHDKVKYRNLALVITDEQHRFGVRQRESLAQKGKQVHVLVMSATPIPRTLAIILYGDLHISVLDELPANRLPVKNCVVNTSYRETAYRFMEKEIAAGHQVYIICPMVEEGEMAELEDVVSYTARLKSILPAEIQIAALHGKMKPAQKNRIMEAFAARQIDILVSTTVIEVGINVPNATVMMVENAERFGLAQLHQLRGRVGRGDTQSYCIFMSKSPKPETLARLKILNESNDGFYIASQDLKLRGPGDLFGIRQSGALKFVLGDIFQDASILQRASDWADRILYEDASLTTPQYASLGEYLKNAVINEVDFRTI